MKREKGGGELPSERKGKRGGGQPLLLISNEGKPEEKEQLPFSWCQNGGEQGWTSGEKGKRGGLSLSSCRHRWKEGKGLSWHWKLRNGGAEVERRAIPPPTSVAEVQFRTDAENRNRPNRTDSSVQVRFSPATPVVSSVLGSQISKILRTDSEPVWTGPNRFYFKRKSPGNNQEITLIFDINGDIVGVSTLTSTDSHDKSLHNARTNDNDDWGMGCWAYPPKNVHFLYLNL